MSVIKPFKAWRPRTDAAQEVACVPYDVINTAEARELAEGKPHSFLHVIRPEIDLPKDISVYDPKVYEKGQENLKKLLNSDLFMQEEEEALYIYRLVMDGRSQTGIFGCVSVEDYENEVILKHELTRPAKEDDRTRHILTQQAHAEPVMMTFRDNGEVTEFMEKYMLEHTPVYNLNTEDGISHTIWKVENTTALENSFAAIPKLYIADGHHRCASAARAAKEMASQNPDHTGDEEYNFFPAVLFPMAQMEILAYNRIVNNLPENFMKQLKEKFELRKNVSPTPTEKGSVSIYIDESWYGLSLPESAADDVASSLDVALIQEYILEPLLDITDQRTDPNIDFVGGIRGTGELEDLVDSGEVDMAISMYPTRIGELLAVSDAGLLMPPKSTWFEPKLRSGLLVHTF